MLTFPYKPPLIVRENDDNGVTLSTRTFKGQDKAIELDNERTVALMNFLIKKYEVK